MTGHANPRGSPRPVVRLEAAPTLPCLSIMTDLDGSDPPASLPVTPRRREADDWALVLIAEGISAEVIRSNAGFTVGVADGSSEAARRILDAWRRERSERSRRLALPRPTDATPLDAAMAYLLALGMLAFHLGLDASGRWAMLIERGRSQAALVLEGEWWRLITALTIHTDLSHVLGNTLFGGFFLAMVAGRLGIGIALLCFVTTGALGNLANAIYYGSAHGSVGASTGVFGLVGILAGLAAWRRHQTASPGRGPWVALGAGLALVAMLGGNGPRVDFSAHLFGLAAGSLAGGLLAIPFANRPRPGPIGQAVAGLVAMTLLVGTWLLAKA